MSFTSLKYVLFFAVAAAGWYLLPQRLRRYWLLLSGYLFYAFAGIGFLVFLLAGTAVSYGAALAFERGWLGKTRLWIRLGVGYTLGVLFLCKYFNFFAGTLFPSFGGLKIGLPLGLSFYSFAVCGYLWDVAGGKLKAERDVVDFAGFVVFFPVLFAGPISKARELLPQLKQPTPFSRERLKRGALRFVWGAWKKMVMADLLAHSVDAVYAAPAAASGGEMLLAAVLYSVQIYLDFSAYSDMAIGCAEMLGFRVGENFRAPYLSRSVKEFWKKWHISLTDWFREYLYIPLGGSRKGKVRTWLNVLIVFAVSGLWHGASWTFVLWGLLNGAYQVVGSMTEARRAALRTRLHISADSRVLRALDGLFTFALMTAAWILFRADTLADAVFICKRILLIARDGFGGISILGVREAAVLLPGVAACLWEDCRIHAGRERLRPDLHAFGYWGAMTVLLVLIAVFGAYGSGFDPREFVYFRF